MSLITIIRHPQSGTYYIGQPLIVVAEGNELSYQWQVLSGTTWNDIAGAVAATYYPEVAGEYSYRVRITTPDAMLLSESSLSIETEDGTTIYAETEIATSNVAETVFLVAEVIGSGGYMAYIKSNTDFSLKDYQQFETYEIMKDIEYADKSTIKVINKPNITDDDFVILKKANKEIFVGICEDYSSDESEGYTITLRQAECLFDRQIFVGTQSLISSTGIEDFIKSEIEANWTNSGDTLLDKDYITVVAVTHTPLNISVNASEGVYNLKTFLGNAKEYYGIFLDFVYDDDELTINIRKDSSAALPIDVTVSDVNGYNETYNVDVLAKLLVKWLNTTTSATTNISYYLKTNRTITTNSSDPDRAEGIVRSLYLEKESQAEVYQEVLNQFSSNTYEHKITFDLNNSSKAYPAENYYVGRKATIKTKTGIKTSIITGMAFSSERAFISFTFGKLKVTLIDKLRGMR